MSWVFVAVAAVTVVGGAVQADSARKAANKQTDALNAAKAEDAAQKAQAETNANAAVIASKKRRRASTGLLASTDPMAQPMGGSVLGAASDGAMKTIQPAGRSTLGGA